MSDFGKEMLVVMFGLAAIVGLAGQGLASCSRIHAERFKACIEKHSPLECEAAIRGAP